MPARLRTALVAGPVVIIGALAGGVWLTGLILAAGGLAAWELRALLKGTRYPPNALLLFLGALLPPLATALHSTPVAAAGLLAAIVLLPHLRARSREGLLGALVSAGAGLYVGVMFSPPVRLSEAAHGSAWLVTIIIGTWACDVAAFLVGRRWGRTHFVPKLSPQKSVEGMIAGMAAALVVGAAAGLALDAPRIALLGLGALVGAAAILGDLAESVLKRWVGAKDSGWIMPGHGGILDRIDSLLLAGFVGSLAVSLLT